MSKENLEKKFLVLIRETMIPIWKGIHESDLAWKRIRVMPDVYSEAMCRHSCCYMMRLFKELSIYSNFKPVKGSVSIQILEKAPFYSHFTRNTSLFRAMMQSGTNAVAVGFFSTSQRCLDLHF